MPAYERFSPLMKTIDLPLPDRYQWLFDQYKHLDFLVCHTHNSRGISTFEKVQPVIQQKTKRYSPLEWDVSLMPVFVIAAISHWKPSLV